MCANNSRHTFLQREVGDSIQSNQAWYVTTDFNWLVFPDRPIRDQPTLTSGLPAAGSMETSHVR
jgi:hypothetical protein